MNTVVGFLLAVLVYPGIAVALVAAWALTWVRGMTRGALSGGDIALPLRDLGQVRTSFEREATLPEGTHPLALNLATAAAVLFPLLALVLLPVPGNPLVSTLGLTGDLVAETALLLGMPLARMAIGWAIPSPQTRLAADRSARLMAGAVVALVLSLAAQAQLAMSLLPVPALSRTVPVLQVVAHLLAAAAAACTLPVLARATAIREHEGETDLAAGELSEISGSDLGLFRIGEALQLVAVAAFFVAAFLLPLFASVPPGVNRALIWLVGVVVTAAGIGAWEGMRAQRPAREDRPPLSWWLGAPVLLSLAALVAVAWVARV